MSQFLCTSQVDTKVSRNVFPLHYAVSIHALNCGTISCGLHKSPITFGTTYWYTLPSKETQLFVIRTFLPTYQKRSKFCASWPWPKGHQENGFRKVAFLLRESVLISRCRLHFQMRLTCYKAWCQESRSCRATFSPGTRLRNPRDSSSDSRPSNAETSQNQYIHMYATREGHLFQNKNYRYLPFRGTLCECKTGSGNWKW